MNFEDWEINDKFMFSFSSNEIHRNLKEFSFLESYFKWDYQYINNQYTINVNIVVLRDIVKMVDEKLANRIRKVVSAVYYYWE